MYYPLSQIKTNLYSNNDFTRKSTGDLYTGYYWKTSTGQYFTGKTPQDLPNEELVVATITPNQVASNNNGNNLNYLASNNNSTTYNTLNNINPTLVTIVPTYFPTQPTLQDYKNTEFVRYFCKKTNEVTYTEISQDTYNLLINQDPSILWQLYFPFNIPWSISGDKQTVAQTNRNIVDLTIKNLKLPRFNDYLKNDYTKYYK